MDTPKIIQGALAVDDRGEVSFVNDFNFSGVKRFYMVKNHRQGFIRAWHAHKKEAKYATVLEGAVLLGAVAIDNWETPSKNIEIFRTVMSEKKPTVIYIPAGYANGFMTLTENTKIIFFSTSSLEESQGDDFRYNARYWDIWNIEER